MKYILNRALLEIMGEMFDGLNRALLDIMGEMCNGLRALLEIMGEMLDGLNGALLEIMGDMMNGLNGALLEIMGKCLIFYVYLAEGYCTIVHNDNNNIKQHFVFLKFKKNWIL